MIDMNVCKLHLCTSIMHITTRVVVVAMILVMFFIILNWNLLCRVVYLNMDYSIAITWIFIHVKKYIKITTCSISLYQTCRIT